MISSYFVSNMCLQQFVFFILVSLVSTAPKESIHIIEDLPIGTSIYTFSTEGCTTSNGGGTYRFVDSQKNSNDFFLIDPYTGRVTTKKLIDRDDFCLRRMCSCSKCEITLEVLCVNAGQIFFTDLSIIVDDRNDHAPQFPKSSIDLDVLENVPIGYLIPIDAAIDPDYGQNSIQGYRLIEENGTTGKGIQRNKIQDAFQIEFSNKSDLLALRLVKTLDRETCDSLFYTIQAFDGGQPQPLTSRLNVNIHILDVNDMSPVFDRSDIHVLLSESTSIGALVARLHAFDGDTGLNGLVHYSIVSLDPPSNGTFVLASDTGEIRLGKRLDYEKEKHYRIRIKAQDSGPQQGSIPAFATVNIDVKDENDNRPLIAPSFNDDPKAGVYHTINSSIVRVRENTPNGTFLGHISINDLDQGENGRVSWSLESNGSIAIKKLSNTQAFLMFTQRVFDREEQSKYDITLRAHDHGIEPGSLSSTLNFSLIIIDENDNEPRFDKEFYTIDLLENVPIGTIVTRFHATDADEENTPNSQIEYLFGNNTDDSSFALNASTGELSVIQPLDREEQSVYELEILASDHGQPQALTSLVNCTIRLVDVNDNYPIFDLSAYHFEIAETSSSNLVSIGQIHASDADEHYSQLHYTIMSNETATIADNDNDEWPFGLTTNGTLFLKTTSAGLDYERRSLYIFSVMASDNGGLNATVPVTIVVLNRNDFCPQLLNNRSEFFFNTDLWPNANQSEEHRLELFDGDNDTCLIELLNFKDIFRVDSIERNVFVLRAHTLPERELYILQFRLSDLLDSIHQQDDQPCIRRIQLVVAIGTNETNITVALDTAREYLEALRLTSIRSHSYFDLTLLNVILLFILLSIAILVALVAIKVILISSSSSRHRRRRQQQPKQQQRKLRNGASTLYRLQGPTETQLPLLENGPGDHSLTSSLILGTGKLNQEEDNGHHSIDDNEHVDEQQQHLLGQFNQVPSAKTANTTEFKTFSLKSSNNNAYAVIGDILHSGEQRLSSSSSSQNRVRDSGYETTSSSIEQQQQQQQQQQQRYLPAPSPSNVSLSPDGQLITVTYFSSPPQGVDSSLSSSSSSSTTLPRTLKTFSQTPASTVPSSTARGMESSIMIARLAEQEIIEV